MKPLFLFLTALILLSNGCKEENSASSPDTNFQKINMTYPETRQDDVVEDYHGTQIADPYRWLEDDHSEETGAWVDEQIGVTESYMKQVPFRDRFSNRLQELWEYERFSSPFKEGDKYYFFKNDGLQNQNVLYSKSTLDAEPEVVLDPNKFSDDGTASLGAYSFSKDGNKLAYQISEGGSDWRTIYVKDLVSGETMSDKIEWVKFSGISWAGAGFYYSRYPEPKEEEKLSAKNEYHKVYYHKLGTDQKDDRLVYEDKKHPQRNAYASTTNDESMLFVYTSESTSGNELHFKDIKNDGPMIQLVTGFENDYSVVDNDGSEVLILTNKNAPNQKLVKLNLQNIQSKWDDVIPEAEQKLQSIRILGEKLFATYLKDASSSIKVFDLKGNFLKDLELPGIGSIGGPVGKRDLNEAFYSFSSFTTPTSIYALNTDTYESSVYRSPEIKKFNSDDFVTNQVWYQSKDGTKVPMFITHKKGLEMDGKRPTLLYGYGGFDISLTPGFNPQRIPILENNGIYVVANIRGGGEFGKKWHKAGTLENKQNVFDDFQAAAEYLIKNNYTNSNKLAIEGGSNGGLLVGACMTQRPDLYKVAFPRVGVLDMLRYHKFTIGWAWATDYGRSDDPEAFKYLSAYSPLHNVKQTAYPATMIMTADHDDRVVPAHSFKFAAELQSKHNGDNPVLIRIDKSAGHGAGKSTSMRIKEAADMLSFMFYNLEEEIQYAVKN
ncbi:MAG: prolyl oligopeptidase family serine peptidase [Bacteroidota bacterium]